MSADERHFVRVQGKDGEWPLQHNLDFYVLHNSFDFNALHHNLDFYVLHNSFDFYALHHNLDFYALHHNLDINAQYPPLENCAVYIRRKLLFQNKTPALS
jgi:hypothetical protein